jgi:predicted Zn-ribbon and HTH transcriptional regulator
MPGVARIISVIVAAYVICPVAIVVMRDDPFAGLGLIVVITSAVAAQVYHDRRRAARHWYRLTHRLCTNCGYDIRATPSRCPECGTRR